MPTGQLDEPLASLNTDLADATGRAAGSRQEAHRERRRYRGCGAFTRAGQDGAAIVYSAESEQVGEFLLTPQAAGLQATAQVAAPVANLLSPSVDGQRSPADWRPG